MINTFQPSFIDCYAEYIVKCSVCHKDYKTKSRSVGSGSQRAICPSCRPGEKLRRDREAKRGGYEYKDLPLSSMPERKDLSAEEFAECVGRLLRAMIGEASETIAHGKQQERVEAVYFLKGGGIEDWISFSGLEYSQPLKKLVDKAAAGKFES